MSIDESKCKLCHGNRKIKLQCLICNGDPTNCIGQVPCNQCVGSSGFQPSMQCNETCKVFKEINTSEDVCGYRSAWCLYCKNELDECKKCNGTALMCYLCSGTGKMQQWCPACILKGDIKVIED
jgi:hypothetical protein